MKRHSEEAVEDWLSVCVPPTDTQHSSLRPFSRADEGGGGVRDGVSATDSDGRVKPRSHMDHQIQDVSSLTGKHCGGS